MSFFGPTVFSRCFRCVFGVADSNENVEGGVRSLACQSSGQPSFSAVFRFVFGVPNAKCVSRCFGCFWNSRRESLSVRGGEREKNGNDETF